jgi:hypothetical protein
MTHQNWWIRNRKSNYVCIECKKSKKGEYSIHTQMVCNCGKEMMCIGEKWRVPKKQDKNGWKKLKEHFKYLLELRK